MHRDPKPAGKFLAGQRFMNEDDPELVWRMISLTVRGINWYAIWSVGLAVNLPKAGEIIVPQLGNKRRYKRPDRPVRSTDEVPTQAERRTYTCDTLRRKLEVHVPGNLERSQAEIEYQVEDFRNAAEAAAHGKDLSAEEREYYAFRLGEDAKALSGKHSPYLMSAAERAEDAKDFTDSLSRYNPQASGLKLQAGERNLGAQSDQNEKSRRANSKQRLALREYDEFMQATRAQVRLILHQPPSQKLSENLRNWIGQLATKPDYFAANYIEALLDRDPLSEDSYSRGRRVLVAEEGWSLVEEMMSQLKRQPELYRSYQLKLPDLLNQIEQLGLPPHRRLVEEVRPYIRKLGEAFMAPNDELRLKLMKRSAEKVLAVLRDRVEPIWLPARLHHLAGLPV